jgi:hypothetical protein
VEVSGGDVEDRGDHAGNGGLSLESEVDLLEKTARSIRQRHHAAPIFVPPPDVPRIALLPTVNDASLWCVPTMVISWTSVAARIHLQIHRQKTTIRRCFF